jgi:hypothetical protein
MYLKLAKSFASKKISAITTLKKKNRRKNEYSNFFKSGKGYVRLRFLFFRAAIGSIFIGLVALANSGCGEMQNMVKGVQRSNEAVVLTQLRSIQQAQQTFSITNAGRFGTFDELVKSGLLNETFKGLKPVVTDYVFVITLSKRRTG